MELADDGLPFFRPAPDYDDEEVQRNFLRELRMKGARIPARLASRGFSAWAENNPKQKELALRARGYVAGFKSINGLHEPNGVYIYGLVGAGKSHLMAAILIELISAGHSGLYRETTSLFRDIKAGFDKRNDDQTEDPLQEAIDEEILMLDDIAAGHALTPWEHETIFSLIDERYQAGKATLITSNVKFGPDLAAKIGDRSASRIGEMCQIWTTGDLPDWRDPKRRRSGPEPV